VAVELVARPSILLLDEPTVSDTCAMCTFEEENRVRDGDVHFVQYVTRISGRVAWHNWRQLSR
jgi:hypothetical protein